MKYFSKDWKYKVRRESFIGNLYGVLLNRLGVFLFKNKVQTVGSFLISKGGGVIFGKHYQNCFHCGREQLPQEGLHMVVSKRGSLCGIKRPEFDKPCEFYYK